MKKVISLALCVMMLAGFMAINTNAAIPVAYPDVREIFVRNFDGVDESTSSQLKTGGVVAGFGDSCSVVEVDGNKVMEFKFGGGEYTGATRQVLTTASEGGFSSSVSGVGTKYTFEFDLYPVNNTSGFGFIFSNINGIHIYPSALTEGMWQTIKVDVDNGSKSYWIKQADADDSTYRQLVAGTDYYSAGGLGSTTFFLGADTRYMGITADKYDLSTVMSGHYYLDNAVISKYYPSHRNIVYSNTKDSITSVGGAAADLKLTGINHSDLNNWFSVTFDAVRTDGDQPITFMLGVKGATKSSSFHIINTGMQGVKYTYKFNVNQGLSSWQMPPYSAFRKSEFDTEWTELVVGTDFYNISHQNGNSDFFRLIYYAGSDKYPGNTTVDANTVWTVDNIQVTNTNDTAMSGVFEKTETGISGYLGITKLTKDYAAIVAFYEGDVFKGAAAADISVEGVVNVNIENVDTAAANLTARLFLWNSTEGLVPLQGTWSISDMIR